MRGLDLALGEALQPLEGASPAEGVVGFHVRVSLASVGAPGGWACPGGLRVSVIRPGLVDETELRPALARQSDPPGAAGVGWGGVGASPRPGLSWVLSLAGAG